MKISTPFPKQLKSIEIIIKKKKTEREDERTGGVCLRDSFCF